MIRIGKLNIILQHLVYLLIKNITIHFMTHSPPLVTWMLTRKRQGRKEGGADWREPRCLTRPFSSLATDLSSSLVMWSKVVVEHTDCLPETHSLASLLTILDFARFSICLTLGSNSWLVSINSLLLEVGNGSVLPSVRLGALEKSFLLDKGGNTLSLFFCPFHSLPWMWRYDARSCFRSLGNHDGNTSLSERLTPWSGCVEGLIHSWNSHL